MRKAITVGVDHSGKVQVLLGPDTPIAEQLQKFKALPTDRVDSKFSEIQVWFSDAGISKRRKYLSADQQKVKDEALKRDQAKLDERVAKEKAAETATPAKPPPPAAKPPTPPAPIEHDEEDDDDDKPKHATHKKK